ncbi:unnamed protein product [Choristocarpus tenellus]
MERYYRPYWLLLFSLASAIIPVASWILPGVVMRPYSVQQGSVRVRMLRRLEGGLVGWKFPLPAQGPRRSGVPGLRPEAGETLVGLGVAGLGTLGALRLLQTSKSVRVVTDIDDTVKSSGNVRLAGIPLGGIDAQYKRGTFYPGVFQFALEVSRYRLSPWETPLPVAVLTARACELLFALEIDSAHPISQAYRSCGEMNGFSSWGLGPILYGSVQEWVCTHRKSKRKVDNFTRLVEGDARGEWKQGNHQGSGLLVPGGGYIFVGDTGEGDSKAGECMCTQYPELMRAVFLHFVSDSLQRSKLTLPKDRVVNEVPIVYFRTYVGASVKALSLGLMNGKGMERVINEAKKVRRKIQHPLSPFIDKGNVPHHDFATVGLRSLNSMSSLTDHNSDLPCSCSTFAAPGRVSIDEYCM